MKQMDIEVKDPLKDSPGARIIPAREQLQVQDTLREWPVSFLE